MAPTTDAQAPPQKKTLRMLTPSQLAVLKKGPKANVLVGPAGNRFIVLEGASVSLLSHFSLYAKQRLIDESATTLYIPNGSKKPIVWIYKYMRANETDAENQETFDTLAFDNLVQIYTHSAFLHYKHLMGRVLGRLKGRYSATLPSIEDLKTFSTFVAPMYDYAVNVLVQEMTNPWTCNYSAYTELANTDHKFSKALSAAIQKLLIHRVQVGTEYYKRTSNHQVAWSKKYYENVCNPDANPKRQGMKNQDKMNYTVKLSLDSDGKSEALSVAKEKNRHAQRPKAKKATNLSQGAKKVQDEPLGETKIITTKKTTKCYTCGKVGHFARDCEAKAQQEPVALQHETATSTPKVKEPFTCYRCGEDGHMACDCTADVQSPTMKVKRPVPTCYNCNEEGHLSRSCTVKKKRAIEPKIKRPAPICYSCNEKGHLARDCTAVRQYGTNDHTQSTTRDTASRKYHFRRTQNDRAAFIGVAGNGEGLRTCDREARQGEKTRTGLII